MYFHVQAEEEEEEEEGKDGSDEGDDDDGGDEREIPAKKVRPNQFIPSSS
jgi:hypothetical protein